MKNRRKVLYVIWWIYILVLFLVVVIKFRGSFGELRERMSLYSMEGSINYNLVPFKSVGSKMHLMKHKVYDITRTKNRGSVT